VTGSEGSVGSVSSDVPTVPGTYTRLETITAVELRDMDLRPLDFVVKEILPKGCNLLGAPPKYGKSWMMLDGCLSIALGESFLDYETSGCSTLYLALEDGYRRLKDRTQKVLNGRRWPDNFHMAVAAATIDSGLPQQIAEFKREHPDTGLVVVDLLNRVRGEPKKGTTPYQIDYSDMAALKQIADDNDLCVFVVHHTRKMKDEQDVFNMISGTNGIMGAADTIWVMMRENRDDPNTKLFMTGREVDTQSIVISMDWSKFRWKRKGSIEEIAAKQERQDYENDPAVKMVKKLLEAHKMGVSMTPTDCFIELGKCGGYGKYITPNELGKGFKRLEPQLIRFDKIRHDFVERKVDKVKKRIHTFMYINGTVGTSELTEQTVLSEPVQNSVTPVTPVTPVIPGIGKVV